MSAARNVELFSNSPLIRFPDTVETVMLPIGLDGEAHLAYRQVLVQAFSPKSVADMLGDVRQLTAELIDKVVAKGGCDFAKEIAEPLPVILFMKLMGFPLERLAEFRTWVLAGVSEPDPQKRQRIWDNVLEMSSHEIRERERERRNDLISRLLDARIDGRPPTFEEMQAYCLMLFVAGLDTVVNAMSLVMRHLAMNEGLQVQLRADPALIPEGMEDLLRRTAANTVPRFIGKDETFFGAPLRRGDFAMLLLPTANNDPRRFANPREIELDRAEPHIVFNAGPHRCVGSHLARLEVRTLLEEWFKRVPPFRLDPNRPWRFHTGFVFSVDELNLVWDIPEK